MPKSRVFLSLGTNQGDKKNLLQEAVYRLEQLEKTSLLAISSLYRTAAWGRTDQEDFYNMVLLLETQLEPPQLLDRTQEIEKALGRVRSLHWGPRTMDIDILLFGDRRIDSERLQVPHPHMTKRRFVLEPLSEIAPKTMIFGRPLGDYLEEIDDEDVEKIGILF